MRVIRAFGLVHGRWSRGLVQRERRMRAATICALLRGAGSVVSMLLVTSMTSALTVV